MIRMEGVFTLENASGKPANETNVRELIKKNKQSFSSTTIIEKIMPILLLIIALISIFNNCRDRGHFIGRNDRVF